MRISVSGLGKLGASMAAAIASRGHNVIGVDIDEHAVVAVNEGRAPVQETGLDALIAANSGRLRATTDPSEAVAQSEITFVVVPTPSDATGMFSTRFAVWAFREIGAALAAKTSYHNVVLTSTVAPGATRRDLLPVLEASSGRRCGPDFGLCYSPEFIALGSVIRDFLNPDFTLIGQFDERSGEALEQAYAQIMPVDVPCKRMTIENAELTKLAINTFVTTKIAYANMLAEMCEKISSGDVDVVSDAVGTDMRIGRRYLTGGLGYGGPCFPRDNIALNAFAQSVGVDARLARATDEGNRAQAAALSARLMGLAPSNGTIAVLGLAYKPHSHVVQESQGIRLAEELSAAGARVVGYDPLATEGARQELAGRALILDDLRTSIGQADLVVIATPDPAFARLTPEDFPVREPQLIVFDCWRHLRETIGQAAHVKYMALGVAD
jgi:UDPglucose 6-dehydrogenase